MKSNRKLVYLIACLIVFSLAVTQASDRMQLRDARSVSLPSYAILDENAQPVIASSGKVGFVSSVTSGALISFSLTSGKIISSTVVGDTAGPISMVEVGGKRLIAVPAVNDPASGHPATVTIIDATKARSLDMRSLIALPLDAAITPGTRALLTRDGRFCLIASSLNEPALFSFDAETGQMVSRLSLPGRPSEMALYEGGARRLVAIASAVANTLSSIKVDDQGQLSLGASFTPTGAAFDASNNPVFSLDGRRLYIAASTGDHLFAIASDSGALVGDLSIASPQRLTIGAAKGGSELIAVTHIRRPINEKRGVTVVTSNQGSLAIKSEFAPPDGIEFSRANNVAFDNSAEVAFIASTTGLLFAFSTETGELESYHLIGSELRRVALSEQARSIAAVRSTPRGDEVVIIGFDMVASAAEDDESLPVIDSISPSEVEQGQVRKVRVTAIAPAGRRFAEGSLLVADGEVIAQSNLLRKGKALEAKLDDSKFARVGAVPIQVRAPNGTLSQPKLLTVKPPHAPKINRLRPSEVPGPVEPFTLKVFGENFRWSSKIVVGDRELITQFISAREIQANIPEELARTVGDFKVRVKDSTVPDLVSNEQSLLIFGPRISDLGTTVPTVVAGAGGFGLRIRGDNFREGAQVKINGESLSAGRVQLVSSKFIKASVPNRLIHNRGKLVIAVENADGNLSNTKEIEALAPVITDFEPGKVVAGWTDVRVVIRGQHFRRRARLVVSAQTDSTEIAIGRKRVRFRSNNRLIVTLTGEQFNALLARPNALKFTVFNPNNGGGVASDVKELNVVGPEISDAIISPLKKDPAHIKIVIEGANFRKGAVVRFLNEEGLSLHERTPSIIKEGRVTLIMNARRLEKIKDAMPNFQLRVVNPGGIESAPKHPREITAAESDD